jgi:hypothetical protein
MSNTVIAASLTLDAEQASTSVKSFKQQLREAQNELIGIQEQFGETSTQAIAAAKGVGDLKAKIKDAKEVADLFNPEKKFQAFGNAVRASVGGITALTGAMALFGGQSEEVQAAILKVQGALALTEGVNTLADAAKDFTRLKVVAMDAFNGIKAAIGSTGIGLFVIALGVIVAYWGDIKNAVGLASRAQEKNLETATKAFEVEKSKLDILQSQDNLLKQQGVSEQEILDIKNKQLEASIKAAIKQLEAQKVLTDQATQASIKWKATLAAGFGGLGSFFHPEKVKAEGDQTNKALELEIKKLQDQLAGNQMAVIATTNAFNQKVLGLNHDAAVAGITDAYKLSQIKLKNDFEAQKAQITQEYTNVQQRNELIGAAQRKYEAEASALSKANARTRAADLRKILFDTYTANIQDQEVLAKLQLKYQLDIDLEAADYEIANLTARNKKKAALTKEYDEKINTIRAKGLLDFQTKWTESIAKRDAADSKMQTDELNEKLDKEKELNYQSLKLDEEIGNMRLDQAGQKAAASMEQLHEWYDKKMALVKGNAKAEAQLFAEYERQKTLIAKLEQEERMATISSSLGQAADLFGRATAAGKVLAIASATIDTYLSAQKAYTSLAGIPFIGPTIAPIAAGIAILSGLANIKKIVSVQVPGGGGSSPSGISVPAPLTPRPQVSNTQLPQNQINQIGNATVRAFVIESDVTNSQERITRLNRAARLGG